MRERESSIQELSAAWKWREERGALAETEALRVFHGPAEGTGALRGIAIDRFGGHFWITEWERGKAACVGEGEKAAIADFLKSQGAASAVALFRPRGGLPQEPVTLFGEPPEGRFPVREGEASYAIQLLGARHPGLFLDHLPLRRWLRARSRGWRVLNTFAYTGSLSVSCGLGDAAHVTTLDLSKPTIEWARENWKLNRLSDDRADFISGDVFEWLPRLSRKGRRFDCVILDPPSFSHGTKGRFSTSKDLKELHGLALDALEPGGVLVTSINSANVSWAKYEADVSAALRECRRPAVILSRIDLPETFPTPLGSEEDRYLKGWVLRV